MRKGGYEAEVELVKLFRENGFGAIRIPGSGRGTKEALPDVLACYFDYKNIWHFPFAIEVKKSRGRVKYIRQEQVNNLMLFSQAFGACSLLAVKFTYRGWHFERPTNLERTEKNSNFIFRDTEGLTTEQFFESFTELFKKEWFDEKRGDQFGKEIQSSMQKLR